jgi:hypothetical protein
MFVDSILFSNKNKKLNKDNMKPKPNPALALAKVNIKSLMAIAKVNYSMIPITANKILLYNDDKLWKYDNDLC